MPHVFLNTECRLRSGWWVILFLVVLAALLFPLLLFWRDANDKVPLHQQAAIVLVASLICQALRRKPLSELFGTLDWRWPRQLLLGCAGGALLMGAPALALGLSGEVSWTMSGNLGALGPVLGVLAVAAFIEELLFRGFVFQRFLEGVGEWPAQLIIAGMFLLTHIDALGGAGALKYLGGANIFLASILFGLAYIRTRSLALPLGLHFGANVMQGPVLGFGVSGDQEASLVVPAFQRAPDWLTGGPFGLEASVPGFLCLIVVTLVMWRLRP